MLDDFLTRAVLGAIGVALAAAPLGCILTWRRMAFFGDATAHAGVLGVALALAFELPIAPATLVVALVMAWVVSGLSGRQHGSDMILAVLSHGALAAGIVAISFVPKARLDLESYLFGDILAIGRADLTVIYGGALAVGALLAWRWQRLITATISPELAAASGIRAEVEQRIVTLALALVVAVAIKVVGALLIGALLIIPAATARPFVATPERMVLAAAGIGVAASVLGLYGAWEADSPAGPSIVCAAMLLFFVSRTVSAFGGRKS